MLRPATIRRLEALWDTSGALALCLRLLAWIYGRSLALHQLMYRCGLRRTERLPVPVVVVGNVVVGGPGKTPTLLAVVEHLQRKNWVVGVISRGYGRRTTDCREVTAKDLPEQVGDEPLLISRRCGTPVFVAGKRIEAAKALLKLYPSTQIIVADDGLQHLPLERDVEIVVFDERGLGNHRLLPSGWLREPWPRRQSAKSVLILKTGETKELGVSHQTWLARRTLASVANNGRGEQLALTRFEGRRISAFAGIARPQAFFDMLEAQGLVLTHCTPLPDHFDFANWQLSDLGPTETTDAYFCTEKDAVKVWSKFPSVWSVALQLVIPDDFFTHLDAALEVSKDQSTKRQIRAAALG